MATKTEDPTALVTDTVLASMKQGQELAFSGLSAWAELAGKAFALPSLETLPMMASVPSPKEFIEASFGFAEELLASQKELAIKLVDTMTPASPKKSV
jgi:hypothetical protein